jgi:hypothetical protein
MRAGLRRIPDVAWAVFAIVAGALAFWKLRIIDPPTIRVLPRVAADHYTEHFPNAWYGFESLASGTLPFWNPYQFVGMPFLAVPHTGTFYPGNFIYLFTNVALANELFYLAHLVFAGLCLFAFLRAFELRRSSAVTAALTFMFNGWMLFYCNQLSLLACMCWLPALLLLVESSLRGSRVAPLLFCLSVTSLIFNGATEYTTQNLSAAGLYAAFRLVEQLRRDPLPAVAARGALLLACIAVGVGLAAFQISATLELVEESGRLGTSLTLEQAIQKSNIAPHDFLLGTLEGRGLAAVGVLPFVGVFLAAGLRRWRVLWLFALGLGVLSAFLVFGGTLFALYHETPIGGFFRRPHKFLHLYAFAQSLMAGLAIEALWQRLPIDGRAIWRTPSWLLAILLPAAGSIWLVVEGRNNLWLLALLIALGVFTWVADERVRRGLLFLVAALQVAGLFFSVSNQWVRPIREPDAFELHAELLESIKQELAGDRVYISHAYWSVPGLMQKQGMMKGFRVIGGYEQLALARYDAYFERVSTLHRGVSGAPHIQYMGQFILDANSNLRLLDLASTRLYIVQNREKIGRAMREWAKRPNETGVSLRSSGPGDIRVYARSQALPRAYFAQSARVVEDPDTILDLLAEEGFDARREVLIEAPSGEEVPSHADAAGTAQVEIVTDGSEEVVVEVRASAPGYLVLNDAFYPGWRVERDGAPAQLRRANLIFRAVEVPAGVSSVRFVYEPVAFRSGLAVAQASAGVLLIAVAAVSIHERRRRRGSGS